jgi:hypothetical protein
MFVAAVRIAQEAGGQLAETLERLGEGLRRKAALEGKIEALTAQGRLQGWVMVCMDFDKMYGKRTEFKWVPATTRFEWFREYTFG